jgi:anti-sigma-K factor RskA
MMDERMEEQAALYVLGALNEAEAQEFRGAIQADPELQEFVARLRTTAGALAGGVPLVEPPPELRAKILGQVVPSPKTASRTVAWLPWAMAACFGLLCVVLFSQESRLRKTIAYQQQQIGVLNQLAQVLESSTNSLQEAMLALQETNRLASLRIALLTSLAPDAPKTVAVTLWDNQRQSGVFMAQNLKPLPAERDYELWVMDENQKPVAAGVFHLDTNGGIRMDFKPGRLIKTAGKFAVTEEVRGGVTLPTLKNLVLAGN